MGLLLQALVDGILIGGIYGLIGIGLTLIFGVMKIINFAQGALMMLGMYVTYYLFTWFGLNPYLSLPFSAIALFLLGALIQRGVLDRVLDAPEHNQLLVTMGLMLIIENAALVLFSPDFRTVKVEQLSGVLTLGNVNFEKTKLIAFLFALLLTVVLYWFLQKTYLGKAIRAVSIDRDGAALSGIQVRRVNMITFGIGAGLAAVARDVGRCVGGARDRFVHRLFVVPLSPQRRLLCLGDAGGGGNFAANRSKLRVLQQDHGHFDSVGAQSVDVSI